MPGSWLDSAVLCYYYYCISPAAVTDNLMTSSLSGDGEFVSILSELQKIREPNWYRYATLIINEF